MSARTEPLPLAGLDALQRAATRHKVASTAITRAAQTAGPRDLTADETADFTYLRTVVRDARTALADAGHGQLVDGTENAPLTPAVAQAVTAYTTATTRYDELTARPATTLTPAEHTAALAAQQDLAAAFGTLADAGRLDLIGAGA